jgi:hypothetical protein
VAEPVVVAPARSEPEPLVDDSPTTILDDVAPAEPMTPAATTQTPAPAPAPTPVKQAAGATAAPPTAEPKEPAPPREPWLRGRPAAVLTGLVVGALIVAATAGSLRLCTLVKGTSSCGGPGLFLLVAILVVAVLVGAAMLRAAAVPQAMSTSFLAVGLLSVVTLLFLVGSIFQWWMIIVIPIVSVGAFLLSHWVTTTYIEPEDAGPDAQTSAAQRQLDLHDIR